MYELYTRQALPSKYYRELLGAALCVFNANNAFIIENILHTDDEKYNWYELIDKESGQLINDTKKVLLGRTGEEINTLFSEIVKMRNRIVHSYQITDNDGEQRLATKTRIKEGNEQSIITEEHLLEFIKKNERLCFFAA